MATRQYNVRLSDDLAAAIERAVEERGYESASPASATPSRRNCGNTKTVRLNPE
jgi:hypothetical protein